MKTRKPAHVTPNDQKDTVVSTENKTMKDNVSCIQLYPYYVRNLHYYRETTEKNMILFGCLAAVKPTVLLCMQGRAALPSIVFRCLPSRQGHLLLERGTIALIGLQSDIFHIVNTKSCRHSQKLSHSGQCVQLGAIEDLIHFNFTKSSNLRVKGTVGINLPLFIEENVRQRKKTEENIRKGKKTQENAIKHKKPQENISKHRKT